MADWFSYSLADLILFSEQTYLRLFGEVNLSLWPLPIFAALLGLLFGALILRGGYGRLLAFILVSAWLCVAWQYHYKAFAPLHWPADGYALLFILQAIFLTWEGLVKNRLCRNHALTWNATALLLAALIVLPLLPIFTGRDWMQAEVFGIAPDPTVIATVGLLFLSQVRQRLYLYIIPLLWCVISAATLLAIQSTQAIFPAAIVFIILARLTASLLKKQTN